VSTRLRTAARTLVLPTLVVAIVLAILPGHAALVLRIYALLVCAYALGVGVLALRKELPAARPLRASVKQGRRGRGRPVTLSRLEQEVELGVASSFDLHHRLRPRLRALASDLLLARHGVSLEDDAEHSRRLLGPKAWDLVQPERSPPKDRLARGISVSDLTEVVESLERV
jgi:hypothetical protein